MGLFSTITQRVIPPTLVKLNQNDMDAAAVKAWKSDLSLIDYDLKKFEERYGECTFRDIRAYALRLMAASYERMYKAEQEGKGNCLLDQ